MKTTVRTAVTGLATLAVASTLAVAAPTAATAATCRTAWGSTAEHAPVLSGALVTGVRTGRHACFDRMVVDLKGRAPGYSVKYVSNVYTDGAGQLVPLRGGAKLQVIALAPAYDSNTGTATYNPANKKELVNVTGYSTFRQIAWAGSFEGQTTFGLGVRARLPFRVFTIQDATSSRLVIDVAHHW